MQEFNCFYRLINKQITSSRNFGISKVCNMGQEARIFKLRGTQNNFLTRSTARGEARRTRRRSRQPYWKSVGLSCLFCVLVSNHYSIIVLFLWSFSTYNAHINTVKAAKIVTLKPFPSSTNFDPDLRPAHINCFTICLTNYLTICLTIFAIQTTNQFLVKSCLRWLLVT